MDDLPRIRSTFGLMTRFGLRERNANSDVDCSPRRTARSGEVKIAAECLSKPIELDADAV